MKQQQNPWIHPGAKVLTSRFSAVQHNSVKYED